MQGIVALSEMLNLEVPAKLLTLLLYYIIVDENCFIILHIVRSYVRRSFSGETELTCKSTGATY